MIFARGNTRAVWHWLTPLGGRRYLPAKTRWKSGASLFLWQYSV